MNPATLQSATTSPTRTGRPATSIPSVAPVRAAAPIAPSRPRSTALRLIVLIVVIGVVVGLAVAATFGAAAILVSGSLG